MTRYTVPLMMACVVLAGCAGGRDPTALYLLDQKTGTPPASDTAAAPDTAPRLTVMPVEVAPYLDTASIVYQTDPKRVVLARNNRWAAPLSSQLTGGLYDALSSGLPGMNVYLAGSEMPQSAYRLVTRIERFQGHYSGVAQIAGSWHLFNADDERIARQRFEREVPLQIDGYPALVSALARGWHAISQSITTAVTNALTAEEALPPAVRSD